MKVAVEGHYGGVPWLRMTSGRGSCSIQGGRKVCSGLMVRLSESEEYMEWAVTLYEPMGL